MDEFFFSSQEYNLSGLLCNDGMSDSHRQLVLHLPRRRPAGHIGLALSRVGLIHAGTQGTWAWHWSPLLSAPLPSPAQVFSSPTMDMHVSVPSSYQMLPKRRGATHLIK